MTSTGWRYLLAGDRERSLDCVTEAIEIEMPDAANPIFEDWMSTWSRKIFLSKVLGHATLMASVSELRNHLRRLQAGQNEAAYGTSGRKQERPNWNGRLTMWTKSAIADGKAVFVWCRIHHRVVRWRMADTNARSVTRGFRRCGQHHEQRGGLAIPCITYRLGSKIRKYCRGRKSCCAASR